MSHAAQRQPPPNCSFLDQSTATLVDQKLMGDTYSFALEQLMELAGLAVAHVVARHFSRTSNQSPRVVAVCGPGNNGGDGLVAARHLRHFGYDVAVIYPKRPARAPFPALVKQLETMSVPFIDALPPAREGDVVIDAVFGFSFKVPEGARPEDAVRAPFGQLIQEMQKGWQIVSVDIPSGWDVEKGDVLGCASVKRPDVLVSLTLPKLCAKNFSGAHYLGGRFVPPMLAQELGISIPDYPVADDIVRID